MLSKARITLLFICLVSCIYVLRDSHTSPGTFLKNQVSRTLAEQNHRLTDALCDNEGEQTNDISQGERDKADSFRNSLSKIRDGNLLVEFIEGPEPREEFAEDYIVPVVKYAAPWIAFFVITIILCIGFSINWCCMNLSCNKKAKCCGPPSSTRCKKFYMLFSLIFMIFIFGAGIAGVVFSSGVIKGGSKTICSAGILIDKLIDGSQSEDWVGLELAVDDFQAVLDDYNTMTVKLILAFDTSSMTAYKLAAGVDTTYTTASVSVTSMYNLNKLRTVSPRADPEKTTNILSPASYVPTYISNLTTETNSIKAEISAKKKIVDDSCLNTDIALTAIKVSDIVFFYQLIQAKEMALNASRQIDKMEDDIEDAGGKGKDMFKGLGKGLAAIFSAELVIGVIASLSIVFLALKGGMCMSKGLNVSWCTLSCCAIFGWVLSALMFPLSLVLFEGCEVGNKVVTEPLFFNQTFNKFLNQSDEDMRTTQGILYRCIHGDGDIIAELNLTEVIGVFEGLFVALDDMAVYTESIQPVQNSAVIPEQQSRISNYRSGLISDAQETTDDLTKLNSLTSSTVNKCTAVQDTWVLNSALCPASAGTVFQSSSTATFNLKNPTCIGYNNWVNQDINQRYTTDSFPTSCAQQNNQNQNAYLQKFVDNFVDNRDSVENNFAAVSTSLAGVSSNNDLFMGSVKTVANNFQDIRDATKITYHALWDEDTGFIRNANCTFIRKGTTDLLDSLCVRFLSSFFQATVMMIVISFFSFFGVIMLFCLTKSLVSKDARSKYELARGVSSPTY